MEQHRNSLAAGYKLHWYVIKRILGQGGFGITYLAEDTNLNQLVAIKEYLPIDLAMREQDDSIHPVSGEHGEQYNWGLDRFMSEAQTLAQFKHPNIVRVLTVFPENNTAYMVMEYEQGRGLHEILKERKTLPQAELENLLEPLLDGLAQVHEAGFIHRDIKPPNIYVREDGSPVLLDFGSARQSLGAQTRTLTSMVSPGFAPFEQYVSKSDKQGPWTDIYGLGATLYRSCVGRSPAEAMDRSEALLHTQRDSFVGASEIAPAGYTPTFLEGIDHALAFKAEDRVQTISEWRNVFSGAHKEEAFDEAETALSGASNGELPTSPTITIKASEPLREAAPEPQPVPKKRWYRSPWKIVLVVFGILIFLSAVDENKKTDTPQLPDGFPDTENPIIDAESNADPDNAGEDIAELLNRASRDIDALRLTSPTGNNAVEKYQHILSKDPDNEAAVDGMKNVASAYLDLAGKAMEKGSWKQASSYVDKAERVFPDHPDLASLNKHIENKTEQTKTASQKANPTDKKHVDTAISTSDKRKLARIVRQLKRDPESDRAKQELRKIAVKYEDEIKKAINEENYDRAEAYVDAMLEYSPDSRKLRDAKSAIAVKRAESK